MADILYGCKELPVEEFQAGNVLLDEGAWSDKLYVLISGEVAVLKGKTEVARVSEPGAVFGEISALLGVETSARVAAVGEVRVHVLENAGDVIARHTDLTLHIARVLARRLVDATRYLADVKRQYEGQSGHFGMVDQVLETLLQQQERWPDPGARRVRRGDPRL